MYHLSELGPVFQHWAFLLLVARGNVKGGPKCYHLGNWKVKRVTANTILASNALTVTQKVTTLVGNMKIAKFEAENFMNLKVVEITPQGSVIQLTGANGAGKTSILNAIYFALCGVPKNAVKKPVRQGAQKAVIRLTMGDVLVTRRFDANGTTQLRLETRDHKTNYASPQTLLNELMGEITFDPLAFTRMEPRQQLDTVRKMVKLDVDIDELDKLIKEDYDKRREAKKEIEALEIRRKAIAVPEGLPAKAINVESLVAKMRGAAERNAEIERIKAQRDTLNQQRLADIALSERTAARLKELHAEMERMEVEMKAAKARMAERDKEEKKLKIPEPINTADLESEINAAQTINNAIERRKQREAIDAEIAEATAQAQALDNAVEEHRALRETTIMNAKMPIDGLNFDEKGVLYKGIPFDQASSAEQIRVSVALAMAANPKLKVLRIKDGSLLDENGLALIASMAEKNDYQIWIERVNSSGTVGVYLEDGSVVSTPESRKGTK
jgi:hypothetical protein